MGVANSYSGWAKILIHNINEPPDVNEEKNYPLAVNDIHALEKDKIKFIYGNYPEAKLNISPPCSIVRYVKKFKTIH
jgi:hypothetical protein